MLAQLQPAARRALASPWPYLGVAGLLAAWTIHTVLARAGAPAVPLDDAYIHFQFARAFARGKPFVYSPGGSPVAGATSLLWPLVLALPQLFGARGLALIPWAWGLAWLSYGALAYETVRAAQRVASEAVAVLCGALVLAFSANAWFATSGMEVVPLAWLLLRAARRSAEWIEGGIEGAGARRELLLLAYAGPLLRPEGCVASVLVAIALAARGEPRTARRATLAGVALCAVLLPPALYWVFTGQATQTTAQVKWLPLNPYLDASAVFGAVLDNVRLFFSTLIDGQVWSLVFVPEHSRIVGCLALPALLYAGAARGASARAWLLVLLGLGIFIPTTYDSFLWNRLRYLWPFATPWLIGVGVLCDQLGELALRLGRWFGHIRYALLAFVIAALANKYSFALWDLAESSAAISAQHVELANWAKRALPADARIGVNDTGAIAYLSERAVFDIVGLTTPGEARYWVAGTGSRFEHYERLPRAQLPTHFIVYPHWFGLDDLLGECPEERTVHATILGGTTMQACRADYSVLGSAERPTAPELAEREPLDVLDVADLDSEAAHDYELRPAAQVDDVVASDGVRVDGQRQNRTHDRFRLRVAPRALLVARLGASEPLGVELRIDGRPLSNWQLAPGNFQERVALLPDGVAAGTSTLELVAEAGKCFSAAHFWIYAEASR